MRTLKTAMDPQPRTREMGTFHPDILRLLDVFTRIERSQERLRSARAGDKH
jgi:hypothetical protein